MVFNQFYVVKYTIGNLENAGEIQGSSPFCITLSENQPTASTNNYNVLYYYTENLQEGDNIVSNIYSDLSGTDPTKIDYLTSTDLVDAGFSTKFDDAIATRQLGKNYAGNKGVVLGVGNVAYIYFAYVLVNPDVDATFTGNISWTLDSRYTNI